MRGTYEEDTFEFYSLMYPEQLMFCTDNCNPSNKLKVGMTV